MIQTQTLSCMLPATSACQAMARRQKGNAAARSVYNVKNRRCRYGAQMATSVQWRQHLACRRTFQLPVTAAPVVVVLQ